MTKRSWKNSLNRSWCMAAVSVRVGDKVRVSVRVRVRDIGINIAGHLYLCLCLFQDI